jgi:probable rRNA maturation factor
MSGGVARKAGKPRAVTPAPGLDIDIMREAGQWARNSATLVRRAATRAYEAAGEAADAELCVVLADDAFVRKLNKSYRGKDKPTNVLSFPAGAIPVAAGPEPLWGGADRNARPLGDIVLAAETIAREAEKQGKSLGDHLSHLVVHGLLHLLGEDHEDDDEAEAMEARERTILASLGIADPYAAKKRANPKRLKI